MIKPFEIEVPLPEKERCSELKSAALLQSKLQRLCAADFDSIHVIRCSDYKSLRRACLAVDLLDLKLFPQTKACTTRVRFEIEDLVTIDEADCRLPKLFIEFVRICKLVQYLDALLCTGYLKHKKEPLKQLHVLGGIRIKQLDFCCEWRGEQVTEPYPRARARKALLLVLLSNHVCYEYHCRLLSCHVRHTKLCRVTQ